MLVIDMTSIKNTDIKDPKKNGQLVGHLNSKDFFGVKKNPIATLAVKKFVAKKNGTYDAEGILTIKKKSHPITFNARMSKSKSGVYRVDANTGFNRATYDVRYGSKSFFKDLVANKIISDKIKLKTTIFF